ncbi:MAG: RNA-binding transcriptional accessory protein [Nannocystis sp.]|uniref:Tex family protein n=1 Tax=Nannocystis sp. TaxID=1962667 RepID=UPI00242940C9|nr:Tex family protein [Nannocystis sp.]MBK9755253.1 RNA-binding transcriptional accessory protein [Nannocystis sp.]
MTTLAAPTPPTFDPVPVLARELSLPERGVAAVVRLLAEGATVPFIARYRKELTGGLDEVQIRAIEERRIYVLELEDRRAAILASIGDQGLLTNELRARVLACASKAALEDLYLPFKPKRRTRAMIARERGLTPLAERILAQPRDGDPQREAAGFVDPAREVADVKAALAGARDIVAERIAEDAELRSLVREACLAEGTVHSSVLPDKTATPTKFELYYDFEEKLAAIPSHRFLAVRRGEQEGVLRVKIGLPAEALTPRLEARVGLDPASPFAGELAAAVRDGYVRLLAPGIETDLRIELKMKADRDAVEVFAQNLRTLLLAAPLGGKPVIGVDPGLRSGCKCVAIDATGAYHEAITIYPSQGAAAEQRARQELLGFVRKHGPAAIAVGNGTGGREAEALVREVLSEAGLSDILVVAVNEAGASVYSASEVAREEFPELDLTLRGAISIGRRLQDPLAELVKIDPKAIGVGQYQHDVNQPLLARKLDQVVESCVNHVGVDLNTASAPLLSRVAGLRPSVARSIVEHRTAHGAFRSRAGLLAVAGLGPRGFEQAAGFLRIRGGEQPLDASAVHPERYPLVERIAADLGVGLAELVGSAALAARVVVAKYLGDGVGEPTLRDILGELQKPGRDPRERFDPPKFRADITAISDLKPGLVLEGVVTNVTAFGAFIDVGVHQDGLCHISQLSDRFVKDPHSVVKAGDKLRVRVLEVDPARKRISLSAKLGEPAPTRPTSGRGGEGRSGAEGRRPGIEPGRREPAGAPRDGARETQSRGGDFGHNPFARLLKR